MNGFYRRVRNILKRYPLSLTTIGVILYLSLAHISSEKLPKVTNIDKIAHFCMYAGFCSVLWFEYYTTHKATNIKNLIWGAIIAPITFSAAIEIAQSTLTKYRGADWYDLLFNTLGALFAAVLGVFVIKPMAAKYKLKKRQKKAGNA